MAHTTLPSPRPAVEDGGRCHFGRPRSTRDAHSVHEDEHGVRHVHRYADVSRTPGAEPRCHRDGPRGARNLPLTVRRA